MQRLVGKIAVVTGGTSGMGRLGTPDEIAKAVLFVDGGPAQI